MRWIADARLAALFDSDQGAFFTVVLIGLLIAGVIMLVLNLSTRPRTPPALQWEPVPEDPDPIPRPVRATPLRAPAVKAPAAPRRRA